MVGTSELVLDALIICYNIIDSIFKLGVAPRSNAHANNYALKLIINYACVQLQVCIRKTIYMNN